MAVIRRKAEVEHDEQTTVRDSFKDPATKQFNQRLKVASLLWKKVHMASDDKVYCHNTLRRYSKEVRAYKKS
ncbi:hypothetical protein ACLUV9_02945 [Limosilactobacillus balticus]